VDKTVLLQRTPLAAFGPFILQMSPVTGLARLPERIVLFVSMGNFSPVARDENSRKKPKMVP